MALVKSFNFIDRQTNVPVVDISSITGSDILNAVENELKDIPFSLKELESSLKDKVKDLTDLDAISELISAAQTTVGAGIGAVMGAASGVVSLASNIAGAICDGLNTLPNMALNAISGAVGSLVRTARDALSPIINAAAFVAGEVESFISGIFPAGVSSSTIRAMSNKCKNKLLSASLGSGSGFGNLCGGGKSACGSGTVTGIINALTGNKFGSAVSDVSNVVNGIVGLSTVAYDSMLCGAFGTLISNSKIPLSGANIARAAAGTISNIVGTGNIKAVADISKSVQGLNVMAIVPGSIDKLLTSIPKIAEKSVRATAESGFAGLELLNNNWNKSTTDSSIYSFNENSTKAKGTVDLYKADSISNSSRNIDSYINTSKYSEIAFSLGDAKNKSNNNFDFAFA